MSGGDAAEGGREGVSLGTRGVALGAADSVCQEELGKLLEGTNNSFHDMSLCTYRWFAPALRALVRVEHPVFAICFFGATECRRSYPHFTYRCLYDHPTGNDEMPRLQF